MGVVVFGCTLPWQLLAPHPGAFQRCSQMAFAPDPCRHCDGSDRRWSGALRLFRNRRQPACRLSVYPGHRAAHARSSLCHARQARGDPDENRVVGWLKVAHFRIDTNKDWLAIIAAILGIKKEIPIMGCAVFEAKEDIAVGMLKSL